MKVASVLTSPAARDEGGFLREPGERVGSASGLIFPCHGAFGRSGPAADRVAGLPAPGAGRAAGNEAAHRTSTKLRTAQGRGGGIFRGAGQYVVIS